MLRIQHLSKSYQKGKNAVEDLSLEVEAGDIYGFIGHNGAGKTTTLRAVTGILDFNEGEIEIDGLSIQKSPVECKKRFAFIPDNPDLYEHLTGIQYLNFIADLYEVGDDERTRDIGQFSSEFELTEVLGDLISSYSHGMRQKLAILSALIHHPKLLILDEPFVGLDPKAAYTLKKIMTKLCEEGGAVFFSTHVLEVAEKLCNKIAIIKNGRIIADGQTEQVIGTKSLESVFLELTDPAFESSGLDKA